MSLTDAKLALMHSLFVQLRTPPMTSLPYWEVDKAWGDADDPRFAQARVLEQQIMTGCEVSSVSESDLRALCMRMLMLYVTALPES